MFAEDEEHEPLLIHTRSTQNQDADNDDTQGDPFVGHILHVNARLYILPKMLLLIVTLIDVNVLPTQIVLQHYEGVQWFPLQSMSQKVILFLRITHLPKQVYDGRLLLKSHEVQTFQERKMRDLPRDYHD